MQTTVLKNEDLDPTVMGEILEFRSQVFEEVYQLASEKPDSYSPEKPDEYDKQSVHFILRDEEGTIRAYARIIFGQITELPIWKVCPTVSNPQASAVEASYFGVCPSYRGDFTGHGPLCVLFAEMMKYSLVNGINIWHVRLLSKFYYAGRKLLNLSLQRLGDRGRLSRNNYVYPCLMDVTETVVQNRDKRLYQYILSEWEKLAEPNKLMAQKLAA